MINKTIQTIIDLVYAMRYNYLNYFQLIRSMDRGANEIKVTLIIVYHMLYLYPEDSIKGDWLLVY